MDNAVEKLTDFNHWYPLSDLSFRDIPQNGGGFAYMLRRRSNLETLYIGSTDDLYRRIFIHYIGGSGGHKTKLIHNELVNNVDIGTVEIAWNRYADQIMAEKRLLGEYLTRYGCLPVWNALEQTINGLEK